MHPNQMIPVLRAANSTAVFWAELIEQHQDLFLVILLQAFAGLFMERGVVFIKKHTLFPL